jgi:large subunit ribosomal protein L18
MSLTKKEKMNKRKKRERYKLLSVTDRLRLTVFKSNRYIYAQIVDDKNGFTLASVSSLEKELKVKCGRRLNVGTATNIGKIIAERALEKNITEVVFDRSGYPYHGRIKALADAAREKGLKF